LTIYRNELASIATAPLDNEELYVADDGDHYDEIMKKKSLVDQENSDSRGSSEPESHQVESNIKGMSMEDEKERDEDEEENRIDKNTLSLDKQDDEYEEVNSDDAEISDDEEIKNKKSKLELLIKRRKEEEKALNNDGYFEDEAQLSGTVLKYFKILSI
jgi:hypothetical protein